MVAQGPAGAVPIWWTGKHYGERPARTSSTICPLNSGGYGGLVFGIVDSSLPPGVEVSTRSGQLQWTEEARNAGHQLGHFATQLSAAGKARVESEPGLDPENEVGTHLHH